MSVESEDYRLIECSRCGRTYRWERRLAGRVVICRCTQKITVQLDKAFASPKAVSSLPASAPQPDSIPVLNEVTEPEQATSSPATPAPIAGNKDLTSPPTAASGEVYELQESSEAGSSGTKVPATGALKFDTKRGGIVPGSLAPMDSADRAPEPAVMVGSTTTLHPAPPKEAGPDHANENEDVDEDDAGEAISSLRLNTFSDVVLPVALMVTGLLITLGSWRLHFSDSWAKMLTAAGILIALQAVVFLPIALWATVQGSRWMGIVFGPLIPLLLKLVAMTLGTGAMADALLFGLLSQVEFDWTHILVGFLFYMVFIGVPMWLWYRTDLEETALVVALQAFPRVAVVLLAATLAPDLFAVQHAVR